MTKIPAEILYEIFSYLETRDLYPIAPVSRAVSNTIKGISDSRHSFSPLRSKQFELSGRATNFCFINNHTAIHNHRYTKGPVKKHIFEAKIIYKEDKDKPTKIITETVVGDEYRISTSDKYLIYLFNKTPGFFPTYDIKVCIMGPETETVSLTEYKRMHVNDYVVDADAAIIRSNNREYLVIIFSCCNLNVHRRKVKFKFFDLEKRKRISNMFPLKGLVFGEKCGVVDLETKSKARSGEKDWTLCGVVGSSIIVAKNISPPPNRNSFHYIFAKQGFDYTSSNKKKEICVKAIDKFDKTRDDEGPDIKICFTPSANCIKMTYNPGKEFIYLKTVKDDVFIVKEEFEREIDQSNPTNSGYDSDNSEPDLNYIFKTKKIIIYRCNFESNRANKIFEKKGYNLRFQICSEYIYAWENGKKVITKTYWPYIYYFFDDYIFDEIKKLTLGLSQQLLSTYTQSNFTYAWNDFVKNLRSWVMYFTSKNPSKRNILANDFEKWIPLIKSNDPSKRKEFVKQFYEFSTGQGSKTEKIIKEFIKKVEKLLERNFYDEIKWNMQKKRKD